MLYDYEQADCRVAWLVAGDAADARRLLGRSANDLVFVDPELTAVKGFGLSTLPAIVHLGIDGTVVNAVEGWDPLAWRALTRRAVPAGGLEPAPHPRPQGPRALRGRTAAGPRRLSRPGAGAQARRRASAGGSLVSERAARTRSDVGAFRRSPSDPGRAVDALERRRPSSGARPGAAAAPTPAWPPAPACAASLSLPPPHPPLSALWSTRPEKLGTTRPNRGRVGKTAGQAASAADHQRTMPPRVMASTSRTRSRSAAAMRPRSSTTSRRVRPSATAWRTTDGRLLVAEVGDEGGGQGRRRLRVAAAPLDVGLEAGHAAVGQHPGRGGQQADRLQQVAGHHRHGHVELERPGGAGEGHRGVVADHLGRHLHHHLGDDRVDLARA